ncbi:hypothetical protein A2997_02170 [Candidatus Nomurabacteria bacterium RIFCSPLOWO2_01_FULL_36_10b]|uniref:Uncharacterized protein n=1 Tax=Candidatus Nomurabacteria bacterium RIFCSPLOWO2_01_FULL_36_10b TaxID=1801766 RepID=A0A1F6WQP8_9BACT|nr:MAG: hypothetical protein A2997_02170 [Candidatus Nomurabacteria bacterium RIFCSPLOWO2_01_FULL_36_10b]
MQLPIPHTSKLASHHIALGVFLLIIIIGIIYNFVFAAPNPGHDWSGVGDSFFAVTGPATSQKTFTFPNANATVLTTNALVTLAQGGTGANLTSTDWGVVYGTDSSTMAITSSGSGGQILLSGGSIGGGGTAPSWSTATYPTTATGTGTILRADGTNWVASTATYPTTATGTGTILRADGTNWVASTATYPDTAGTSGNVLTSNGTNWVSSTPSSGSLITIPTRAFTATGALTASQMNSTTVFKVGIFPIHAPITVNQITVNVTAVGTAQALKICIYSATNGLAKVIDITTASISSTGGKSTAVSSVALNPGNYYIAIGCAATCNITMNAWTSTAFAHENGANIPASKLAYEGTVTMSSAGTCDSALPAFTSNAVNSTFNARLDN